MTRKQSIIFWVITILVLSVFICVAYLGRERSTGRLDSSKDDKCAFNVDDIGLAIKKIYWQRKNKEVKFKAAGKESENSEYWWMEAVWGKGVTNLGPYADNLIYCPFDKDRSHPSSYMSNHNLNVADISKLKDRDKTILLIEREPFHGRKYHCVLADFSHRLIKEQDIGNFKRW